MVLDRLAKKEGISIHKLCWTCSVWKDLVAAVILLVGVSLMVVENYVSVKSVIVSGHQPIAQCDQLLCVRTMNASGMGEHEGL